MKTLKTFFEFALVVMCMLCMAGCQNDEYSDQEEVKEPGLYLRLNAVGDGSGSATRLTTDEESNVSNIHVLYFKKIAENGDDTDYSYVDKQTITVNGSLSTQPYKLDLSETVNTAASTTQTWKVVFIANITPTPSNEQTLANFKAGLQVSYANVLWWGSENITASSNLIPMYCCTDAVILPKRPYTRIYYVSSNNTQTQTYYLIRMMAKFSIINTKIASFDGEDDFYDFEITGISIENGYGTGLVCYNTTLSGTGANVRVSSETTPSLSPSNSATTTLTTPAEWTTVSGKQTQTISSFYTFERGISNAAANSQENCYIKLTGKRISSSNVKDDSPSNYMLPIYKINSNLTVDEDKAGPVLRNHHYQYTIAGVHHYSLRVTIGVANWIDIPITAKPIPLR